MNPIFKAGLLAGLIINLADVPNAIVFAAPKLQKQLDAWRVSSSKAMPAYFVILHFVFGIALVWLSSLLLRSGYSVAGAATLSWLVLVGFNRLFGFGNVLIGNLPSPIFWAFSGAFMLGTYAGTFAGCYWLSRLAG